MYCRLKGDNTVCVCPWQDNIRRIPMVVPVMHIPLYITKDSIKAPTSVSPNKGNFFLFSVITNFVFSSNEFPTYYMEHASSLKKKEAWRSTAHKSTPPPSLSVSFSECATVSLKCFWSICKLSRLSFFRIKDDSETGSIALSPILKRHNAYLVHNETLYCDETDVWRGIWKTASRFLQCFP
jgi:hypothetical protein